MNTRRRRIRTVVSILCLVSILVPAGFARAQSGEGTVDARASVSDPSIGCGESAVVTLTVEGQTQTTGLVTRPVDIVLIFDRSGSMVQAMPNLKTAARFFVDIVDSATDGVLDGVIAAGTRVGVVSFATDARLDQHLTIDAVAINDTIDTLVANGTTNPEPAFEIARAELLDSLPGNSKMIVMFTDGRPEPASREIPATLAAQAARDEGIEIYVVGLGAIVIGTITQWASDPDDQHVYATPSSVELLDIYDDISTAFARSSATQITITAVVDPRFTVTDVRVPRGTVVQSGQEITWTVFQLRSESLALQYRVTHDGSAQLGQVPVNLVATYSDAEGRVFGLGEAAVNINVCSPLRQQPGSPYLVVELAGTPHLWLVDDRGLLHWGGDTRALAGREIDWGRRMVMTLGEIAALPHADPWLSHGLLQLDGAVYLVKWETEEPAPRLLHIQSLTDAQSFGVSAENLGALLLDTGEVEGRVGIPLSSLERGVLNPAGR